MKEGPSSPFRLRPAQTTFVALLVLGAIALGQIETPAGTNLFGDEIARRLGKMAGLVLLEANQAGKPKSSAAGYEQRLVFQNQRQIRGTIVSLDKERVVWRRPDAGEPLRFPRSAVRRIVFSPSGRLGADPSRIRATVQLGGADWLFGDLAGAGSEAYRMKISEQTRIEVPRAQIESIYFATQPARRSSFDGDSFDLDSWTGSALDGGLHVENSALVIDEGKWLGCALPQPPKFEIDFTVQERAERGLQVWLQPSVLGPDWFMAGSVELTLDRDSITHRIFANGFDERTEVLPENARGGQGPASYRVFFDRPKDRLFVLRNGHRAAELKLHPDPIEKHPVLDDNLSGSIQCVGFGRSSIGLIRLERIRIAPWDGLLPEENVAPSAGDRASAANEEPARGNLEVVNESSITFSGVEKSIAPGLFVELDQRPVALPNPECRLRLVGNGELSAAELRIEDGRAQCRSVISDALDLPLAALQSISLASGTQSGRNGTNGDVLVFKDGDELEGSLLSAASGGRLRWRTSGGQEVEFETDRIAGVRFESNAAAAAPRREPLVNLRNGDWVRGGFAGLNRERLNIEQPQLGALALPVSDVWKIYPNPRCPVFDGEFDADAMAGAAFADRRPGKLDATRGRSESQWVYLDGTFISRGPSQSIGDRDQAPKLTLPADGALDSFEMNLDVTALDRMPSLELSFRSADYGAQVELSYYSMRQVQMMVINGPRRNARLIDLGDKISEAVSRVNVRLFVNAPAGTLDLYIDGLAAAQIGRSPEERCIGIGHEVQIGTGGNGANSTLSNIWLRPWNGELPQVDAPSQVCLTNGDATRGAIVESRDGKLRINSEIGDVDMPMEKIETVDFGGVLYPKPAAGRVCFLDGSVVNVESYHWDAVGLAAHSPVLGDFRLSASAIRELVINPSLPRAPHPLMPDKSAKKSAGADPAVEVEK